MAAPEMNGVYDGYSISLFSSEHGDEFATNARKLTAVEVRLQSQMPFEGGAASGDMVRILQALEFREEWVPSHPEWQKEFLICGDARTALSVFFSNDRLNALLSLMKMSNVWAIYVFRGDINLLRIDTPYPLDNQKKLEAIIKKMVGIARVLELKDGEGGRIKADMVRKPVKEVALEVKEGTQSPAFELEEEPVAEVPAEPDAEPPAPAEEPKT